MTPSAMTTAMLRAGHRGVGCGRAAICILREDDAAEAEDGNESQNDT